MAVSHLDGGIPPGKLQKGRDGMMMMVIGDSGGDVNGDFDHGENCIAVDGDDVTHLNIRSAPGKV